MMINFVFVFLSLALLVYLHEFFHFIFAKKYKLRVEEFGFGFPPRIYGKKIKETIYSFNLLPLGGFVKIDEESFKKSPFKSRFWVIFAGVFSFWIIGYLLFSINSIIGIPLSVNYLPPKNNEKTWVAIIDLNQKSPAQKAGLKQGDRILSIKTKDGNFSIESISQFQKIVQENKGKKVELEILRGEKTLNFSLVPRQEYPKDEGPLGLMLETIYIKKTPWYWAPWEGLKYTFQYSKRIMTGYFFLFLNIFKKGATESLVGPVGFLHFSSIFFNLGPSYFLNFLGMASLSLSFFNLLPIPVTDGGRIFLMLIEKIRKKEFSLETEKKIIGAFFFLLLIIAFIVSIRDIQRIV